MNEKGRRPDGDGPRGRGGSRDGAPRAGPCRRHASALLEAGPSRLLRALRGEGGLGRHLSTCPACRGAAERILEDGRALDRALTALSSGRTPEADREGAEPAVPAGGRYGGRRWPLLPLTAAALLGALLLWSEARDSGAHLGPDVPDGASARSEIPAEAPGGDGTAAGREPVSGFSVRAPEGDRLAVFRTRDPNITVVWQF